MARCPKVVEQKAPNARTLRKAVAVPRHGGFPRAEFFQAYLPLQHIFFKNLKGSSIFGVKFDEDLGVIRPFWIIWRVIWDDLGLLDLSEHAKKYFENLRSKNHCVFFSRNINFNQFLARS